jgi:hypothetical protein
MLFLSLMVFQTRTTGFTLVSVFLHGLLFLEGVSCMQICLRTSNHLHHCSSFLVSTL